MVLIFLLQTHLSKKGILLGQVLVGLLSNCGAIEFVREQYRTEQNWAETNRLSSKIWYARHTTFEALIGQTEVG
jgi:hypothetical protein